MLRGDECRSDPRHESAWGAGAEHQRPASWGSLSPLRYPARGRAAGEGRLIGTVGPRDVCPPVSACPGGRCCGAGVGAGRAVRRRFPRWRAEARSCQGPARRVGRCGSSGRWRRLREAVRGSLLPGHRSARQKPRSRAKSAASRKPSPKRSGVSAGRAGPQRQPSSGLPRSRAVRVRRQSPGAPGWLRPREPLPPSALGSFARRREREIAPPRPTSGERAPRGGGRRTAGLGAAAPGGGSEGAGRGSRSRLPAAGQACGWGRPAQVRGELGAEHSRGPRRWYRPEAGGRNNCAEGRIGAQQDACEDIGREGNTFKSL